MRLRTAAVAAAIAMSTMATATAAANTPPHEPTTHEMSARDLRSDTAHRIHLNAGAATWTLTRTESWTRLKGQLQIIGATGNPCEYHYHGPQMKDGATWSGWTATGTIEIPCPGQYGFYVHYGNDDITARIEQTPPPPPPTTTTTTAAPAPEPEPEEPSGWAPATPTENPGTLETEPRFFGEQPPTATTRWTFTGTSPTRIPLGDLTGQWRIRNYKNAKITIWGTETGRCGRRARTADRVIFDADECAGEITIRVAPTPKRTAWKIKIRPKP